MDGSKQAVKRWSGYENVGYYWHNAKAEEVLHGLSPVSHASVFIVWHKDKRSLKQSFAPWMRILPAWLLFRIDIKLRYGKWRRDPYD